MNRQSGWTSVLLCLLLLAGCGQGSDTTGADSADSPTASSPSIRAATVVVDTLRFPGPASAYSIALTSTGYTIASQGSVPVPLPVNIKRIDFDDTSFGLGAGSNSAQVYRAWSAALNRAPDVASLSYWVNLMDIGLTLRLMAENLVSSNEFKSLYAGAHNNAELVTLLFQNVLHRAPSAGDLQGFTAGLDSGRFTPALVLIALSESDEYVARISASTNNIIQVNSLGNRLAANEAFIAVSRGKFGISETANRALVSVTLCRPGTTVCQTIDDILLDTGSSGLRLLPGVALRPDLQLPQMVNEAGQQIGHCAAFGGNSVQQAFWGGVYRADIKIASMTAAAVPIQIADTRDNPQFFPIPEACRNGAPVVNEPGVFNGVLGIGMPVSSCGARCEAMATTNYFGCQRNGCTPVPIAVANQLLNPVALFAPGYNNGTAISIQPVPLEGTNIAIGKLTFGIGTQPNNQLGSAKVFPVSSDGAISAVLNGTRYRAIFDTGAPAHVLNDATLPRCSNSALSRFCPPSPVSIPIVNSAGNNTDTVSLPIVAPSSVPGVSAEHAGRYEADSGGALFFGLPFYFGRTVFTAIDGAGTPAGAGPYIAY